MILLFHIVCAFISVIYTAFISVQPSQSRLRIAYTLAGVTFISGFYLLSANPSHLAQACVVGLMYFGLVSFGIVSARNKLALQ